MGTKILSVSHLAMRTLESSCGCSLEKEFSYDDRKWNVLLLSDLADILVSAADDEDIEVSEYIVRHLRTPTPLPRTLLSRTQTHSN